MNALTVPRRQFVRDLTRVRHMTTVSAVVLGTTFMPLLGLPDAFELRAFQGAVEGFSDARAHVLTPRRDDEAARRRSSRIIEERDQSDRSGEYNASADRVLAVERPERDTSDVIDEAVDMIDAADLEPLPPLQDAEFMAPDDSQEEVIPEIVEETSDATPEIEKEPAEDFEPLLEEDFEPLLEDEQG